MRNIPLDDFASIRIGRRKWTLATAPLRTYGLRGMCMNPKRRGLPSFIVVSSHLPKRGTKRLEAVIHETLHAAMPKATEGEVRRTANAIRKSINAFDA